MHSRSRATLCRFFLYALLFILPGLPLLAGESILQKGESFSFYRIYYQFKTPLPLRYEILPYGNAKLLQARDPEQRLMILSRSIRLTTAIASGEFLRPPGCPDVPDFNAMSGAVRCQSIEQGVPLVRLIHWEKTAGLMHLFIATVQKEDLDLLDELEQSLKPQPAFYYPDDGL
ncbi:MAG: hypothetical protein CMN77_15315 [Spirochaetaceae bacterium]|nr:hypothetical protein [Spirochaetaceae bacterium]